MRVLALAVLVLPGCALLPHTAKVELEHISHPLAGWPCEPQKFSEDEVNQLQALVSWRSGGAYLDAGLGYNLFGRNGSGFYGPSFTGTVRVGYELALRHH